MPHKVTLAQVDIQGTHPDPAQHSMKVTLACAHNIMTIITIILHPFLLLLSSRSSLSTSITIGFVTLPL
ncbi:hypothetical protein E2C01_022287 [Portunus trituberculatus]|uniref:Uncharacterized protein n=1 Tax=Portunus trituberculatus TaxID=210409 RepID=A0A5B7E4Z3_PORTR|nr:hypothetical protein [Portunus trituberculatus]